MKKQIHKTIPSGRFIGKLLEPLIKAGLPLMKNNVMSLAKSVLISLGLAVVTSATDTGIHKKFDNIDNFQRRKRKYHEKSGLLIKGASETNQNNRNVDFLVFY